ncbi:hypothetical protein TRV_00709 [Trichophyton verrucosum HKI 0517]|uniref:Uncharacterized protein n=1 Tax=Trichophyton verrucosum (strain HKI 0517) TaxID=663202 RepID=D4D0W3_TRIVH|nr:uncharacterized protein TRV_00709 [Trichophyton verrucosum HKI 0517]EFE44519.1 hypothetical protein TRV_00709 [Trichophyton verrucosum HKI 0517]
MALNAGSRLTAHGLTSPSRPQETEKSNIPVQRTRGKHPNPTDSQRGAAPAQKRSSTPRRSLRAYPMKTTGDDDDAAAAGPGEAEAKLFAEGVGTNVEGLRAKQSSRRDAKTRTRYRGRQRTDGVGVGVGVGDGDGDGDGDGEPNDVNGGRWRLGAALELGDAAVHPSLAMALLPSRRAAGLAGWLPSYRCQHPAHSGLFFAVLRLSRVSSEYLVAEWRAEQVERRPPVLALFLGLGAALSLGDLTARIARFEKIGFWFFCLLSSLVTLSQFMQPDATAQPWSNRQRRLVSYRESSSSDDDLEDDDDDDVFM